MGAFPAWAQTGASLSGVVTDQTGAALPDVAVTIKNVDTGATRTIATDGGGHYQASGLPPGRIEIRAAKQGFADETRTGISLAVGQDATVDIKMQQSTPDACASGHEFATTDCALTWHGITLYGAYDVGVGWVGIIDSRRFGQISKQDLITALNFAKETNHMNCYELIEKHLSIT